MFACQVCKKKSAIIVEAITAPQIIDDDDNYPFIEQTYRVSCVLIISLHADPPNIFMLSTFYRQMIDCLCLCIVTEFTIFTLFGKMD